MSGEEIERLVEDRSLIRENFTDEQVVGSWNKAAASLEDARLKTISTDSAYQLA